MGFFLEALLASPLSASRPSCPPAPLPPRPQPQVLAWQPPKRELEAGVSLEDHCGWVRSVAIAQVGAAGGCWALLGAWCWAGRQAVGGRSSPFDPLTVGNQWHIAGGQGASGAQLRFELRVDPCIGRRNGWQEHSALRTARRSAARSQGVALG